MACCCVSCNPQTCNPFQNCAPPCVCVNGQCKPPCQGNADCAAGQCCGPGSICKPDPCGNCTDPVVYIFSGQGCATGNCAQDWTALLQNAGYIPVINYIQGLATQCGQPLVSSIEGICCGFVDVDGTTCQPAQGSLRCQGPCTDGPDCPDETIALPTQIPTCCLAFP